MLFPARFYENRRTPLIFPRGTLGIAGCLKQLNFTSPVKPQGLNVSSGHSLAGHAASWTSAWRISSNSLSAVSFRVEASRTTVSQERSSCGYDQLKWGDYKISKSLSSSSVSRESFQRTQKQHLWQVGSPRGSASISESRELGGTMGSGEEVPLRSYQIVVAASRNLGIGKDGQLPWKLPTDMRFFADVTSQTRSPSKRNAVIMGRLSWDSLPRKFRPLKGRLNMIISRSLTEEGLGDSTLVCNSVHSALTLLASPQYASPIETVFIIGGGQILRETMLAPLCDAIHITEIGADIECDTFCPPVDRSLFTPWYASTPVVENNLRYSFVTYVRRGSIQQQKSAGGVNGAGENNDCKPKEVKDVVSLLPPMILPRHDEYQYLNLIRDILQNGAVKGDRTNTGTISKFGCQMRFNLRGSFPLLTTKRVHWRGVVEELLWFISGSTNAKVLQDKDVHIWDGNSTKKYLNSIGLTEREEGDLGPIYGFQWRHFGAKYTDMHANYSGQGFDQLADVIHKIRTSPDDRRIMLSAWNPADLHLMALPPCHMFAQFYVANGELSCQMYQRSCDMGLGVPYNIASYSLLTCIIAHICDLVPGDFIHVLGDAHVYSTHVEPLEQQLKNTPKPFPVLNIKSTKRDIDSFTADDFELLGYQSCGRIPMKMAV
ncbi:hypothetical protein R1flu_009995 [Riccia fluitans]|uniref:DHFR domain-containing protein n=2 Tax=Embryophyta TaxID=3193 RepID=A0ABD1Z4L4_9MARC